MSMFSNLIQTVWYTVILPAISAPFAKDTCSISQLAGSRWPCSPALKLTGTALGTGHRLTCSTWLWTGLFQTLLTSGLRVNSSSAQNFKTVQSRDVNKCEVENPVWTMRDWQSNQKQWDLFLSLLKVMSCDWGIILDSRPKNRVS